MTTTLKPGDLVWREHEPGTWRVLAIQDRRYGPADYLPIGRAVGDPAPAHVVLERVLDHDYRPPRTVGRGHAPRRAGAPETSLTLISHADLAALVARIAELAAEIPA